MSTATPRHRPIRSFVRREGRFTEAQRRAFEAHWAQTGIDNGTAPLELDAAFASRAPVTLEIGFGNGDALATLAAAHPERNYLGIEVHRPGVGQLMNRVAAEGLGNVRVLCADAKEVLQQRIGANALAAVHLWFPDPWHKKRHHKRRIVQPDFVALVAQRLVPGGVWHLATDWKDYAEHMMAVLTAAPEFENTAGPGHYAGRGKRPHTRFEARGARLGHGVWDLVFRRR